MRHPPPYSEFHKYPVTGGTILLAIGATLAWWGKVDISPLEATIAIRQGQLWRILTSTLPHVDVFHLIFNLYWTWVFGTLIEETFGHARTLAIFVLFAIAANGAEFALLEGGVGLSGVGYGLFALVWILSRYDRRFKDAIDSTTVWLFVGWFFLCVALTYSGTMPVANIAHGVGAITGALLGWAIATNDIKRIAARAGVAALVALVLIGSTIARPWVNFSKDRGDEEARLGYDALTADKNDEALKWYRDATHANPRDPLNWYNLGITYDRLNRTAESLAAFEQAAKLDPNNEAYRELTHPTTDPSDR